METKKCIGRISRYFPSNILSIIIILPSRDRQLATMTNRLGSEEQTNPAGIAECLVDPSRRMARHGLWFMGNKHVISKNLLAEINPKGIPLDIFYRLGIHIFGTLGYGQSGFIRVGHIRKKSSRTNGTAFCFVVPVTTKFNLESS